MARWARRSKEAFDAAASTLPTTRFVVVTPGRAGSVLLSSLLDSHPEVRCLGELLGERLLPLPPRSATGSTGDDMDPAPLDVISRHMRMAAPGCTAWGFRVHPDQLQRHGVPDPAAWLAELHDAGFRIITLVRRNALNRALSASIAYQRGTYASAKTQDAIAECFHLEPAEVLQLAGQAVARSREVHEFVGLRSHLALTYEDDLASPDDQRRTASRVFAFLKVSEHEAATPFVPRSQGFAELISNWDELVSAISQTRFAADLPTR